MKLSDYVAQFLSELHVERVFVVTGGANLHLIDSIDKNNKLDYICAQHEQGAVMMADASARILGLGVACGTSGPGATNMLTGALCAFTDSVPLLLITGQVSTHRMKKDLAVRQLGFQEADTVSIFKSATKYASLLQDKHKIRYELEKAVFIATSGRKGPVLIDIPDNLQREDIGDPTVLPSFFSAENSEPEVFQNLSSLKERIEKAQRPILILGSGARGSFSTQELSDFITKLNVPVLLTWGARDLLPATTPLNLGTFGTHGSRLGNFAVQNADLILSIGARLDTHHTGLPTTFARSAQIVMVDIDKAEMDKFKLYGRNIDDALQMSARDFVFALSEYFPFYNKKEDWHHTIESWKQVFSDYEIKTVKKEFNPQTVIQELSNYTKNKEQFFLDTGCSLAWFMSYYKPSTEQRIISAFNYTPMGYALPAAIGGALANPNVPTFCIIGDGGIQMSIQELATAVYYKLPIKIMVFDNKGYSMIKQTQEQWLDQRYCAVGEESGVPSHDFMAIAKAYGLDVYSVATFDDLKNNFPAFINNPHTSLCVIHVSPDFRVEPILKYGFALEDQEPHLPRKLFFDQMLIEPLDSSKNLTC